MIIFKPLFKYPIFLVLCLGLTASVFGQELFEEAVDNEKDKPFELNGYVRRTLYGGKALDKDEAEIKSGYGELSFKVATQKLYFGDAFAEIRFRKGNEYNPLSGALLN